MNDAVDRIVAQWARERPELDTRPMAVIGRLHRLGALVDRTLRENFAAAGLREGEFDVLAALRRAGDPYRLTWSELSGSLMITGGAVTKRVDRLVAKGLVERRACDDDGRGRTMSLTSAGLALVDELVVRHLATEENVLAPLSAAQQDVLADALRTLLLAYEGGSDVDD